MGDVELADQMRRLGVLEVRAYIRSNGIEWDFTKVSDSTEEAIAMLGPGWRSVVAPDLGQALVKLAGRLGLAQRAKAFHEQQKHEADEFWNELRKEME